MAMVHQLTSSGMPLSSEYRKLFCCIYLDVNTSLSTVTVVAGWKTNNCRSFLMNVLLLLVVVVVVVALSWVKAEPLYPHHNYILG